MRTESDTFGDRSNEQSLYNHIYINSDLFGVWHGIRQDDYKVL